MPCPRGTPAAADERMGCGLERDSDALQERDEPSVVLPRVPNPARGERGQEAGARGRRAADVLDDGGRLEDELVARRPEPAAEVDVLRST